MQDKEKGQSGVATLQLFAFAHQSSCIIHLYVNLHVVTDRDLQLELYTTQITELLLDYNNC